MTAAYDALRSGVRRGELLVMATVDRESGSTRLLRRGGRRTRPPAGSPGRQDAPGTGRIPDAARRAELRREVAAQRGAQGLPPYITDAATLDKIADLLVVTLGRGEAARRAHPRSLGAAGSRDRRPPVFEPSTWRRESRRRYALERERAGAVELAGAGRLARGWLRVRYGRPGWLAVRVLLAALVVLVAQLAAPGDPAVWALGVGAVTWLARTGRWDLAPRARR